MKKMYLILLVFVINSLICFGSEQIELSARLGKTISLDSRNYFGLFPDVKDFKSAVLFKDVSINYIEITAGKSEEKSKIILSDSAVSTLAYVIDNFEGIISEPTKYKLNGKLISGLIRISTQFNKKAKPMQITLRDSTKFSGFILYADSSVIVTTPESAYRPASANFKITGFSDIYSISNVDYPIIDGTETIFVLNKKSFYKLSLFKNASGIKVTPPEVLNLIKEQPIEKNQNLYESPLDFDKLYFKRMMVSVDYSYQRFNIEGIPVQWIENPFIEHKLFCFTNYHSFSLDFNYRLNKIFRFQIGYNYESINFTVGKTHYSGNIVGNTLNSAIYYNFWHSKIHHFEANQFFADAFCGVQFHFYQYVNNDYTKYIYDDRDLFDLTKKIRQSYKFGLSLIYKLDQKNYLSISGFFNNHFNYELINYNEFTARYIKYLLSYGISCGVGYEF